MRITESEISSNGGWIQLEVEEMEEVATLGKDPSSRSRSICGGKCNLGPEDTSLLPVIVNCYKILALSLHVVLLLILAKDHTFDPLIYTNFGIGLIAFTLICYVQCSDPGIQNRVK